MERQRETYAWRFTGLCFFFFGLAPGFGRTLDFLAGGAGLPASGLADPACFRVWAPSPETAAAECAA